MKKYRVKRPKDTVEVLILPNKDGSGYQYVNLTKGHICPCRFKTESEALRDMDKKISEGKVLYYEDVEDFCHNELHTYPQHDGAIEHFKHIEELEKEADEYATENYEQCIYNDVIGWETDYEARKQAYLAGAEPKEKRIAELEAQIEKMKCCQNYKHSRTEYEHCRTNKHEKWEIKEK